MADIEKVYSSLDKCMKCDCDDCTLYNASKAPWDCMAKDKLINDALELLKEYKKHLQNDLENLNKKKLQVENKINCITQTRRFK